MNKTIRIARDFSPTPGARYRSDGDFSGQEFCEELLLPVFRDSTVERVIVVLDGTRGYATSFLEEAFGGLARRIGKETCLRKLELVSNEDDVLIDEVMQYINEADAG